MLSYDTCPGIEACDEADSLCMFYYPCDGCPLNEDNLKNKQEILINFCKKVSKQKDCPAEFTEIVDKEFWNLI